MFQVVGVGGVGGGLTPGFTVLQEINKQNSSPSVRCVHCPKVEIFVEMFRANLQGGLNGGSL